MIRQYCHNFLLISLILVLGRCAQVGSLTGGPRDTTPPKLTEALPAQSTLNFNTSEIVLKFDEYVQLKDLKNQLLISPSLATDPEINVEGKKIRITLKKEELLPNTTYRIYFGKAIADMHEGNAIPNFEYIFSTGTYIDTLKLTGTITDAFSELPVADALIGLYTNKIPGDSVIFKNRPEYVTRTLAGGIYTISNLPQKNYLLVAFTDKNKNYIYDGESEKIAYLEKTLSLTKDTSVNLKLFQELPARTFLKKTLSPYYGSFSVIYNRKSHFSVRALTNLSGSFLNELDAGREKDTVTIVYSGIKDSLRLLVSEISSRRTDTIISAVPRINLQKLKSLQIQSNVSNGVLAMEDSFRFTFLNPLDTAKTATAKIHLAYIKDSLKKTEPALIRYSWPLQAELINNLSEGTNYVLKIDSGAFYDLNGRYNDSMLIKFRKQAKNELGKITLKLLLNKKQSYVVQLTDEKGFVARESSFSLSLSSSNAVSIDFTGVTPGTYGVRVIFDGNGNGKWDTGNFTQLKQPETVFTSSKKLKVIADWDVEEEITVK